MWSEASILLQCVWLKHGIFYLVFCQSLEIYKKYIKKWTFICDELTLMGYNIDIPNTICSVSCIILTMPYCSHVNNYKVRSIIYSQQDVSGLYTCTL